MNSIFAGLKETAEKEIKAPELREMPMGAELSEPLPKREKEGLSNYEKVVIKLENLDLPFEVISYMGSVEESRVYKEAGLETKKVGDKICLIRDDIDFAYKDEFGRTNKERISVGLSPVNEQGETVELHHVGQKQDSPFAELTRDQHRGVGNDTILHDKTIVTEIDRVEFEQEKRTYWKVRMESEVIHDGR